MKKKYRPYNFNEKNEYKIYDRIGKKYYKEFIHEKKIGSKDFWDFDKYLEWEEYFTKKYSKGYNNDCNFIHYLIQNYRINQQKKELCKSMLIPICIATITIIITIYLNMNFSKEDLVLILLIGMIIVEIICMWVFYDNQKKEDFYKDCIEVMNKLLTSHHN